MGRLLAIAVGGIALSAVAAIAHLTGVLPIWGFLLALAVSLVLPLGLLGWGGLDPAMGLFGETLTKIPGAVDRVALTFDDGPIPDATPAVLDALAGRSASATFFLLVDQAEAHPELARAIARSHEVGLHGLHHDPWLTLRSPSAGSRELIQARSRLEAIVERPVKLYRPPFGAVSPRLYESVRRAGLELVWCSVRTRDGGKLSDETVLRRCSRATAGDIVLLHEAPSHALVPKVLDDLAARGLRAVTVGALCASV